MGWPAATTMIVTGLAVLGLGLWANGLIGLVESGALVMLR